MRLKGFNLIFIISRINTFFLFLNCRNRPGRGGCCNVIISACELVHSRGILRCGIRAFINWTLVAAWVVVNSFLTLVHAVDECVNFRVIKRFIFQELKELLPALKDVGLWGELRKESYKKLIEMIVEGFVRTHHLFKKINCLN